MFSSSAGEGKGKRMNGMKRICKKILPLFIVLLVPFFSENVSGADNAPGWLRAICITTNEICKNGVTSMADALRATKLPGYRTDKGFIAEYSYAFNISSDAHLTEKDVYEILDNTYGRSTSKDLNIFYYIGHSFADDSDGTNAGMYTGKHTGIPYGDLLQKLASYQGKFVVIIDACWAGHIVTDGWEKLKKQQQNRFSFLLSTASNAEAHIEAFSKTHSFSQGLMNSISYSKKYKKLYSDMNQDGVLTVEEAWNNGSIKGHPFWSLSQQPKALGHTEFPLFQFNALELDQSAIEGLPGEKYKLNASLTINDKTTRTIKWGTSNASVASISATEQKISSDGASLTITLKNPGKATIDAWMVDTTTGKAIPDTFVHCSISVKPADLKDAKIKLSRTSYVYNGSAYTPDVKVTFNGEILKKGTDYTVAYRDNKYVGTAEARITGVGKYKGSVTKKYSIKPVLNVSPSSVKLVKGKTKQLKVTVKGYQNKKSIKVKYTSSDSGVVKVSSNGKITAVKTGTATIKVSVAGVTKKCKCKIIADNYKTIYREALENGTFSYKENGTSGTLRAEYFLLLNIDQKGVPELIVSDYVSSIGHGGYIYTIMNGKLKYCGNYHHKGYKDFMYVKKYKSVYYSWWVNGVGGIGAQLLKLSNGKLKPYKYFYEGLKSYTSSKTLYYAGKSGNNKAAVSKKKYTSLRKKYLGRIKKYHYVSNTESNRKKLL